MIYLGLFEKNIVESKKIYFNVVKKTNKGFVLKKRYAGTYCFFFFFLSKL